MKLRHALLTALMTGIAGTAVAQMQSATPKESSGITSLAPVAYGFREVMVPMRDGVRLQTVIMTPLDQKGPLPILISRGPYGVPNKAYAETPVNLRALAADGYIFVMQNIRGRFKSEGNFSLSEDVMVTPGQGTIETRDAYDTMDWLIKNIPNNNGKIGMFGVSYGGYTTAATLLGPHPALKAVSEQASPVDEWMNDDMHHNGALRLSYAMEYGVLEEADKTTNTNFAFNKWDTYDWYLSAGPLSSINDKYLHGKIKFWNEVAEHPDYDSFWKQQAWLDALHSSPVPNLNVAGFWDQEDPWGPWQIFRHAGEHDPDHTNLMVAGPWFHGAWHGSVSKLNVIPLGEDTSLKFRETIEAPFFAYWLHGKGSKPAWTATTFQTGSNSWHSYKSWPPKEAKTTNLYLHADGSLSFTPPGPSEKDAHRDYVSDPANPVPYRARPISPTYPGGDWREWEFADQRFVDHRPDVLSFVSEALDHDVVITGPVSAELYASTSGTDGDFIVKLIDVYPEAAEEPDWAEDEDGDGPAPHEFAQSPNGYELPIAMEVRRGRYLESFEHAAPLKPNVPTRWDVKLRDHDHVFKAGHRIMVQVQSSWFPIIDRNPQTFTQNIYKAKAADYVAATQRVYTAPDLASRIILSVMAGK